MRPPLSFPRHGRRSAEIPTKIIATVGPATAHPEKLKALLSAGVDVVRVNFAHGDDASHLSLIRAVRKASADAGRPVGVLADLPGPKIRLLKVGRTSPDLQRGDDVLVGPPGSASDLVISYGPLVSDVRRGESLYIADGLVRLTVVGRKDASIWCRVANGGTVRPGNGVNFPDSELQLRAFTRADHRHLSVALRAGVDFVGVSFVGDAEDLSRVREACGRRKPLLVAKIERRRALRNLESIALAADALMVARGDLGVEVPFQEIPGLQRDIVGVAHGAGKPVIVATQILESMIENPRPTRAEASDIANAVREEADALMLSGETAMGRYPLEAVRALRLVADASERRLERFETGMGKFSVDEVLAREACDIAGRIGAAAIVAVDSSVAGRLSRFRPREPIVAIVSNEAHARRFSLYWGVKAVSSGRRRRWDALLSAVRAERTLERGQSLVLVGGFSAAEARVIRVVQV